MFSAQSLLPRSESPLQIVVLLGGPSAERSVSLESGREIVAALRSRGHTVRAVDPEQRNLDEQSFRQLTDWSWPDAVFLALHGTFGEDGTVQAWLDRLDLPYTGSNAESSRIAFCKSAAKDQFRKHGVATPPAILVHVEEPLREVARRAQKLEYPLVVKPDEQGSSLGVSIVHTPGGLDVAMRDCRRLGNYALLEKYIPGEEWTVAFLDAEALPAMRVSTSRDFLDFEAKYRDDSTGIAFAPDTVREAEVTQVAAAARRAVGASGACRVDLRVDPTGRPWVLEVNTIPGFTSQSALPSAALRAGREFGELCEECVLRSLALRPRLLHAA